MSGSHHDMHTFQICYFYVTNTFESITWTRFLAEEQTDKTEPLRCQGPNDSNVRNEL